ncbi:MAG: DUF1206 domain-containing protein [Pseudomonadota bacterium]
MPTMTDTADQRPRSETTAAHEVSGETDGRDLLKLAARAGYASRGVVYIVVGALALTAAFSARTRPEGAEGAIETLFSHPAGSVLVYVLIAGLLCYSGWRFWQSIRDTDHHGRGAKALLIRGGLLASGVTYVFLALFAWRLATGEGEDGSQGSQSFLPGWLTLEPWMLWVAALVPAGVGVAHVWKAIKAKFEKHFLCDESQMRWLRPLSRTGLIARGIVFFLIAFLLAWGGRSYTPEDPPTTRDALSYVEGLEVGGATVGPWLLALLGLGLIAFALYSLAQALYRRVRLHGPGEAPA